MGELEVLHSHSHLLVEFDPRWPTTHVLRCVSALTRVSADRYRCQHMRARDFSVEALSCASYTSIITFSVCTIPEHLAAPKSAQTSGLIYFHGGK